MKRWHFYAIETPCWLVAMMLMPHVASALDSVCDFAFGACFALTFVQAVYAHRMEES